MADGNNVVLIMGKKEETIMIPDGAKMLKCTMIHSLNTGKFIVNGTPTVTFLLRNNIMAGPLAIQLLKAPPAPPIPTPSMVLGVPCTEIPTQILVIKLASPAHCDKDGGKMACIPIVDVSVLTTGSKAPMEDYGK
jgi:hypothetical protein